jgi:transposase-like protein
MTHGERRRTTRLYEVSAGLGKETELIPEGMTRTIRPCPDCRASYTYIDKKKTWHCQVCGWRSDGMTRYTEEEKQKMTDMYNSGKTNAEIAQELGRDVKAVTNKLWYLRKNGTAKPRNGTAKPRNESQDPRIKAADAIPARKEEEKASKLEFHRIPPDQLEAIHETMDPPPSAESIEAIAEVMNIGGGKHGDHSYMSYGPLHYYNASWRHLLAIRRGELLDPETGKPHAIHLACSAIILDRIVGMRPLVFGDEEIIRKEHAHD